MSWKFLIRETINNSCRSEGWGMTQNGGLNNLGNEIHSDQYLKVIKTPG